MLPRRFELRYADLRTGQGEPRLGLGNVGAGHLADVEAVARLPQLLLEHLDVVAAEVEVSRVAQHVHIGGRAIEQHVLLGRAQGLARAEHERLGLLHRIVRAKAVEQRLIDRHPDAARRRPRHGRRVRRDGARRAVGPGRSLEFRELCADVGGGVDAGTVAREGAGHVLVGRACARTLGAEAGITDIGAGHRALQGLSGDRERRRGNGHGNEDARQRVASSAETRSNSPSPAPPAWAVENPAAHQPNSRDTPCARLGR